MKYYLNKILVVEGKEDVSYLSSFLDAEFVTTNGYDIPKEEIEYLNVASKHKEILVLVDPDKAGREIEETIKKRLVKATYLNVDISKCSRGKKDGVAECEQEEMLEVLKPYLEVKKYEKSEVLQEKSLKIELSDRSLRDFLSSKFCLGKCNNKTLIKRLETLQISEKELKAAIEEYRNGN